jgi:hypothetical protein
MTSATTAPASGTGGRHTEGHGYGLVLFARFDLGCLPLGSEPPPVKGTVDPAMDGVTPPLRQVAALDAGAFFGYIAELPQQHAPHAMDYPVLGRTVVPRTGFRRRRAYSTSVPGSTTPSPEVLDGTWARPAVPKA